MDHKIEIASSFLLQSPPGEINDVLNDIRAIVSDDSSLQTGILPALEEYNVAQFITVDVPGAEHQVIVSEAGRLLGTKRFIDPRSHTSFEFDHIRLEASDPQPIEIDQSAEPFRTALESATIAYISDHFAEGVASVFVSPPVESFSPSSPVSSSPPSSASPSASVFIIQIVANKYNPANFWSGRWRSEYTVDVEKGQVQGKVLINVHYYEMGNVQLQTSHTPTISFPPSSLSSSSSSLSPSTIASKLLASIDIQESAYQTSLNDAYAEMGEKTFKGLRRALPLTRQKLDWDKVMGYKLGAELAANKSGFGNGGS